MALSAKQHNGRGDFIAGERHEAVAKSNEAQRLDDSTVRQSFALAIFRPGPLA